MLPASSTLDGIAVSLDMDTGYPIIFFQPLWSSELGFFNPDVSKNPDNATIKGTIDSSWHHGTQLGTFQFTAKSFESFSGEYTLTGQHPVTFSATFEPPPANPSLSSATTFFGVVAPRAQPIVTGSKQPYLAFETQPPAQVFANATFPITVAAETFGEVVDKAFKGTVTLKAEEGGTPVGKPFTAKFVNGVAAFSAVNCGLSGPSTATLSLVATAAGVPPAVSDSFQDVFPTTFTWSGLGNGNWSDGNDWQGGVAPAPEQTVDLVFPQGAQNTINTDDLADLMVDSMEIAGGYTLSAPGQVAAAAESQGGGFLPAASSGKLHVVQRGKWTLTSPGKTVINANLLLMVGVSVTMTSADEELDLNGQIDGSGGITLVGPGTLSLSGDNTYIAGTDLKSGTLQLRSDNALGTGMVTLEGGTLMPATSSDYALPDTVTIRGNVALSPSPKLGQSSTNLEFGSLTVARTSTLTLSANLIPFARQVTLNAGLTIQPSTPTAHCAFHFGHSSGSGESGSSLNFSPQGKLVITNGCVVFVVQECAVAGKGAINVSGGLLYWNPGSAANYAGTLTLSAGGIQAFSTLGNGQLVLKGGRFTAAHTLSLSNQTTVSGAVDFQVLPQYSLAFTAPVNVPAPVTVTLTGNIGFHHLTGKLLTIKADPTAAAHVSVLTEYRSHIHALPPVKLD
jgi:autotransporter-associated beta strand protein